MCKDIRLVWSRGERKEDPIFQKSSPAGKGRWIDFRIKHQLALVAGWVVVGVVYKMGNFAKFQQLCHTLFLLSRPFDWGRLGGKVEDESLGSHETSMSQW